MVISFSITRFLIWTSWELRTGCRLSWRTSKWNCTIMRHWNWKVAVITSPVKIFLSYLQLMQTVQTSYQLLLELFVILDTKSSLLLKLNIVKLSRPSLPNPCQYSISDPNLIHWRWPKNNFKFNFHSLSLNLKWNDKFSKHLNDV